MDSTLKPGETRLRKRVSFIVNVLLNIEGKTIRFTESRNISMSGMFLVADSPLTVGARGKVTISMECGGEKLHVHANCEVVRTGDPFPDEKVTGSGIKFTYIDPESSITLFNIIRYQAGDDKYGLT